jgi:hypothetical protein
LNTFIPSELQKINQSHDCCYDDFCATYIAAGFEDMPLSPELSDGDSRRSPLSGSDLYALQKAEVLSSTDIALTADG